MDTFKVPVPKLPNDKLYIVDTYRFVLWKNVFTTQIPVDSFIVPNSYSYFVVGNVVTTAEGVTIWKYTYKYFEQKYEESSCRPKYVGYIGL